MSEIVLRTAWRRHDPAIERDAELFWRAQRALRADTDVDRRLAELCACAYCDNELVALATASIREIPPLRCKLAMFRCLVAPEARTLRIASQIAVYARDLLETWSRDNPVEEVLGLGAIIQSRILVETNTHAIYPDTKLAFIGYTQEGYQMRVYWFAHARISKYWPGDADTASSSRGLAS
jgi:hypothetical protein